MLRRTLNWLIKNYPGDKGPIHRLRYRLRGGEPIPSVKQALGEISGFREQLKSTSDDKPIFILSAGWRSGSTLMQRLVNSSGQSLIWGEPYGAASICHFMVEPLRRIPRELEDVRFLGEHVNRAELTENFIANLYPPTQDLLTAHKAFWDALLAEPARRLGLSRWGFKEVRLSVDEAHYLKWLYPQAKFIFIYRNPFDAYLSYQGTGDRTWFSIWPEVPICGADDFGKHWNKLVTDFIDRAHEVNGLVVRFEDLIKDEQLIKRISEHIELSIDPSVLKVQVGSSPSAYKATALELDSLRRSASPIIERLGYTAPTF